MDNHILLQYINTQHGTTLAFVGKRGGGYQDGAYGIFD
jgi:hypothetical protein